MSAELALAIPPLIDLSLRYVKKAKELCSDMRHADRKLAEVILRLDNSLIRFTHQVNFLGSIQDMMDDNHREIHEQTLSMFLNKLKVVITKLQQLSKLQLDGNGIEARKVKYTLKKDGLEKAIDELNIWQATSDQSWFLLMRIAGSRVDKALTDSESDSSSCTAVSIPSTIAIRTRLKYEQNFSDKGSSGRGLSLPSTALDGMQVTAIPLSDGLMTAQRTHSNGQTSRYILNHIHSSVPSRSQAFQKDARDLVRQMQHGEAYTFALLESKGFILKSSTLPAQITLVFRYPPNASSSRSLRDVLVKSPAISLSRRFKIAKDLAKAVGYIHTFSFVHKNVWPESVLVIDSYDGKDCSAFLAGFGNFRRDEGSTQRQGDDALERNLYRHPSRVGMRPEEDFCMQHDMYSLGVCLLEIGLWESFVNYSPTGGSPTLASHFEIPSTGSPHQRSDLLFQKRKSHLISLARSRLGQLMGDQYAEIVSTCLTCMDPDNADFGDEKEFQDEDGIRVGVRYIEKVILRLNAINV